MAEIKFHKALRLPNPLNSTHDGVWFTDGIKGAFKIFIVSGGVAVPLNYDDATGNYTAGEGINITPGNEILITAATPTNKGGVKVRKITQEDYDALTTKDPETLYYIIDRTPDLVAVYNVALDVPLVSSGTLTPYLDIAIFPEIWEKTYDWDIVWRDANGLHNLRDFSNHIASIDGINYVGGGITIDWTKVTLSSSSLTIPAGAKLVLRLNDNAPTYER